MPQVKSFTPQTTMKGSWSACAPDTVTNFTAVGYFFARDLFAARHVPVDGIIQDWQYWTPNP